MRMHWVVVLVGLLVAALSAVFAALAPARSGGVSGPCGRTTANKLIRRLPVGAAASHYLAADRVICEDFTGDGRPDLVVTVWTAMNHGAHYWAAYRDGGRRWVRVAYKSGCCGGSSRYGGMGIGIERAANGFVVSQPVYGQNDPACCPSGGTKSAHWFWKKGALRQTSVASTAAG